MRFRTAGPQDVDAIRALTRAAYAKWVPLIGREPMPMQADPAEAVRLHRVDLLEDEGLLGLVEVHLAPDHLWVENLCVRPDLQGRGIGPRLLSHAETLAAGAGLPRLRLLTNPAFTGNVAFYQRHGFTGERTEPFREGFTAWLVKEL
jgi:GNAT superfamily N-acetyltransferase